MTYTIPYLNGLGSKGAALVTVLLLVLTAGWLVDQGIARLPATDSSATAAIPPLLEGSRSTAPHVFAQLTPSQDPENEALGGVLAAFSLEPLAAPCCPLPTSDKAVKAARGVPGVLAAKVNGGNELLVRYDPTAAEPGAIASAVNRASFIVEIAEVAE